jgi:hypothetical protein
VSYFLRKREIDQWQVRRSKKPLVAVKVHVTARKGSRVLVVEPGIVGIDSNAMLVPLPKDVVVESDEGEVVQPTWGFWVSIETFDPYHLLLDWDGDSG